MSSTLNPIKFRTCCENSDACVILNDPGRGKLLLGAYCDACDIDQLLRHDVFFVVNCACECPTPTLHGTSVVGTKRLDLSDDEEQILGDMLEVIDDINDVLKMDKVVLVHCAAGVSRSAAVVLAYLIRHMRMTLVDSWTLVSAARCVRPNLGFWSQLLRFELNELGTQSIQPEQLSEHPAWGFCNVRALFRGSTAEPLIARKDPLSDG